MRDIRTPALAPILDVQHLTMTFGGLTAVADLSFQVFPGEIVAMIGPNGAGKTTVFNVLTATYRATKGSMRFDESGPRPTQPSSGHRGRARTHVPEPPAVPQHVGRSTT